MISTTSGVSLRGPQRMRSCASTGTCLTPKAATRRHACSVKCLGVLPASVSTNSSCQEIWSRRTLLSLATSLITAPAYAAASTSPYEDAKSMQYGLDSDRSFSCMPFSTQACDRLLPGFVLPNSAAWTYRRIRACPGAVNPNCVSTRSLSQVTCTQTSLSLLAQQLLLQHRLHILYRCTAQPGGLQNLILTLQICCLKTPSSECVQRLKS